ncbi:MAG: tetratricopeptide repeat protein [Saprospiraceae bacterium]|nr:tetratricopeptide repeat protein [Saprospiraceae bacterium]
MQWEKYILVILLFLSANISGLRGQGNDPGVNEIQSMTPDTSKVMAWIDLSKTATASDFGLARIYGDSALQLAAKIGFESGEAQAHKQIATACYYGGKLPDALEHYNWVLAYHERQKDELNWAKIMNNIGLVKRNQGKYDEAMNCFFQSLEIKERYPDPDALAFTYKTIGETYAIESNYELAETYFDKALKGFQLAGNEQLEHTMILNIGGFYQETDQPEKSLEYVLRAKAYFEEVDSKQELGRSNYILGKLFIDEGKLVEAEKAFLTARTLFYNLGSLFRVIGCNESLARVAMMQQDYPKAINLAKITLENAREIDTKSQIARALLLLSNIYKEARDYQTALDYLEQFNIVQDSFQNEEVTKTIAELEEKYQSEVKEKELASLTITNNMNELNLKKQRNQKFALLGFLGLLLVIVGLIYNQFRINKGNNRKLVEKNKIIQNALLEKEVLLKEIHHRVKNNLQFISSLLNLQSRHTQDPNALLVLNESKDRINSMSIIHQKLYQEDNLIGVPMDQYIENLLDSLIHSYKVDRKKVQVETNIQDLNLDVDTAIPIGLILNEIITNAFKYAFDEDASGTLFVELIEENDLLKLCIQDNGPGLPEGFDPLESEQFGFELVRSLASKLKGKVVLSNEKGLRFTLDISNYKHA